MNYFKPWEELTIQDDFIFQHVMRNSEICRHFLEKLLNLKIKRLEYLQLEKTFEPHLESKGVRFDLYVEDERGTAYDVEMQTTESVVGALAKRTRYYQSALDTNALQRGDDYVKLKNSFIIFVCTFDPFGESRRMYTFRNRCVESEGLELNDGATKNFLNANGMVGNVDDDIKNFLLYIGGKSHAGKFVERVAVEVNKVKRQDITRVEYMRLFADMMDAKREGRVEGRVEGRFEKTLEFVKNLLREGFPAEQIFKLTRCTQEEFLQAKHELDATFVVSGKN
ncbi:MAG: Rpn family recombination-promoting nuclease/putative transposase [Selenomonadaceae bacterium]|nr:Rpn family recombination-promoting nuclease/putative transposase [Selenomonadaceae bacterium]